MIERVECSSWGELFVFICFLYVFQRNPFAPKVPCHRVVTSSLELGGFNGSWGDETPQVKKKRGLLEAEGVKFNGNKVRFGVVHSTGVDTL